jgi:DNA-binding NarL/FixJ family response regulator
MTLRVLIVDDRAVVRKELRNLLELTGAVIIVGEAEDGWDAIRQVKALTPDIVLMDLEMPGLDGFEATRQIKTLGLARAVIIITVYADSASQQKAREVGADAFFVKGTDLHTLLELFDQFSEDQAEISISPDKQ